MMLERVRVEREVQSGEGALGAFFLGEAQALLPELLETYAGKAQMVYLDPPFATGKKFQMRMRVGERDWKSGAGSFCQTAYEDNMDRAEYLSMMRDVLTGARALLKEDGVLFLHIDYRMSARLRLMMDELFGEENLLNEIIWTYQTGGRSVRHFSRKHDVILFYRKSAKYYFDISAIGVPRGEKCVNHMKRMIDPDGRVYRSIRSGGKIYTYYEDDLVFPSDVWDDVSHMQQKDAQRTGYDTQKPLKLLERIVLCSTRPGDLVVDLFAGSGTTLDASRRHDRRFLGVDRGLLSMHVIRRRLSGANVTYSAPPCEGEPQVEADAFVGVGYYHIELKGYTLEPGLQPRPQSELDALDNWSVGYFKNGAFKPLAFEGRSKESPSLQGRLKLPALTGKPMLRTGDVLGRNFYYALDIKRMKT